MASDVLTLIGIIVAMMLMSPRLALLSFSVVPLMVVATMIFARHAKVVLRETRDQCKRRRETSPKIRRDAGHPAFAQEGSEQEHFEEVNRANRDANVRDDAFVHLHADRPKALGTMATPRWSSSLVGAPSSRRMTPASSWRFSPT